MRIFYKKNREKIIKRRREQAAKARSQKKREVKDCKYCSKPFTEKRKGAIFCSAQCNQKSWRYGKGREKNNAWQREYFHKKCLATLKEKNCFWCKKVFLPQIRHKNSQIYCSVKCNTRVGSTVCRQNLRAKLLGLNQVVTIEEWKNILVQSDFKCLLCQSREYLTMDHITPLSFGGEHVKENLRVLCMLCNHKAYYIFAHLRTRNSPK